MVVAEGVVGGGVGGRREVSESVGSCAGRAARESLQIGPEPNGSQARRGLEDALAGRVLRLRVAVRVEGQRHGRQRDTACACLSTVTLRRNA